MDIPVTKNNKLWFVDDNLVEFAKQQNRKMTKDQAMDFLNKYFEKNQLDKIQKLLFIVECGSRLYGTETDDSDKDYVGVFIAPKDYYLGMYRVELLEGGIKSKDKYDKNTKSAVDITLYEIKQFFKLLTQNNPNILEIVFANNKNIVYNTDLGQKIFNNAELFPFKGLYHRFTGYAYSQKKKMIIKSENYLDLVKAYEDLKDIDDKETMGELLRSGKYKWIKQDNAKLVQIGDLKFNKERLVKKVRKIIKERIDKATHRKEMYLKYGYDCKFASHLIRLLSESIHLLTNGKLEFPLVNRELLLDIKQGKYTIEEVIKMAEQMGAAADELYNCTELRSKINMKEINKLLIDILESCLYSETYTLEKFKKNLEENRKDMDIKFAKIIDENFWNLT